MKRLLVQTIAQSQYEMYVDERLKQRSALISNIIPKNNVSLFRKTQQTKNSRTAHEIKSLKNNFELFSRMYRIYHVNQEMEIQVNFSDMKIRECPHHFQTWQI